MAVRTLLWRGLDAPRMEIVHVEHAIDRPHRADHVLKLQPARQALQKNIQRFVDNVPRGPDNQQGDENRKQWIDLYPSGVGDRDTAANYGERSQGIAEHVSERAAHVDVFVPCGAQRPHNPAVEHYPDSGDGNHDVLTDGFWPPQAQHALVKDPGGQSP